MECEVCGEYIYIEHPSWNKLIDAECPGSKRQKLICLLRGYSLDTEKDIEYVADYLLMNGITFT